MKYKTIIFDKKGALVSFILNRPKRGNAMDDVMSAELASACQVVAQDKTISVVVVRGSDVAFSTGAESAIEASDAIDAIARLECVTIAAIAGDAFDEGLELALSCDIRIASERARFALRHLYNGSMPSCGGTQRLPRVVGPGKALEMILTAETIDAEEALRIGLISRIVMHDKLEREAFALAERVLKYGPIALRFAKEAVNKGMDITLAQGLRLEADLYFLIQTSADRMEGINAFLEKREPGFKGE
jgi:enoyl-CoA hydratase/carnithine racemase